MDNFPNIGREESSAGFTSRLIMPEIYRDSERLDKISASSFEADALCSGRQNLIRTLPPEAFNQREDEEASRGIRLHKAWETDSIAELDEDDIEIYESGNRTGERILTDWCQQFGISEFREGQRELRLWLHDPETLKPLTSAKLDKHFIAGDRVLIDERKSLYCTNLSPAERNYQGLVQAVLVAREYGATHVRVAFNKAMFGRADVVDYSQTDLEFAERSIFYHLWETRQPGAQRRPGSHCRYCIGKPYCKEAGAYALLPSTVSPEPLSLTKENITDLVSAMSPQDLAVMQRRASIIGKILDEVKARLKSFTPEQLAEIGFAFGKPRNTDSIDKVKECFDELKTFGISEAEIWSALKFSKIELIDALRRDQGWPKDRAIGFVKQHVEKFGSTKQSEAPLVEL